MNKHKYIVTSTTTREKEGHPELCWMDIGAEKLWRAAEEQGRYVFLCFIDGELYEYTSPAAELLQTFIEKDVYINVKGEKFTFIIEYATGTLYRSKSGKVKDMICRLEVAQGTAEGEAFAARVQRGCVGEKHRKKSETTSSLMDSSFPPFKPRGWKIYNVVTSQKEASANSTRCWMNIGVEKLARSTEDAMWVFDSEVKGVRRVFYASVRALRAVFRKVNLQTIKTGTERYTFYMDFAEGVLYSALPNSTGERLLDLKKVKDGEEYRRYMKPWRKATDDKDIDI